VVVVGSMVVARLLDILAALGDDHHYSVVGKPGCVVVVVYWMLVAWLLGPGLNLRLPGSEQW
jgi:hypothetical protein